MWSDSNLKAKEPLAESYNTILVNIQADSYNTENDGFHL